MTLAVLILVLNFAICSTNGEICFGVSQEKAIMPPMYPLGNKSQNTTTLYFGLMVAPSEDSDYLNSTVSAVQLALDTINSDPDLLRGYSLHYTLTTSQCSLSEIINSTISQLFGTPGVCKLGLIEAGCTETRASLSRSHWASHFNIPQVTCSPTLQDHHSVGVFSVVPTNSVIIPALIDIITHYNWFRVRLIVENKLEYTQIIEDLEILESLNVSLNITTLTVENHTLKIENECRNPLFEFDLNSRILVLAVSYEIANHLICEAFKCGIKYPKYEFIFVSDHHSNWWVGSPQDDSHYGCSTEERAQVLNHSLALQSFLLDETHLERHLERRKSSYWYCYDAVRILAQAVNDSLSELTGDCIYSNRFLANILANNIQRSSYTGLTGRVEFTTNRARNNIGTEVLVQQYQTTSSREVLRLVQVGSHNDGYLTLINSSLSWPSGVPYDGSPDHVLVTVSVPLTVVYYTLATVGISVAIGCCVFNFAFRKRKVVRLTSPNLNYVIIAGTLLIYLSTYWYFLPSTDPSLVLTACCVQFWFASIGYNLTLGTIIAKLWRVYYIFRNPESVKKRKITDHHLFTFVLTFNSFIVIILLLYTVVETGLPGYELNRISNMDNPSEFVGPQAVDTQYEFYTCSHVPLVRNVFSGTVLSTMILLLLCALFMAFKTRKVKVKGLNDFKAITAIFYVGSFCNVLAFIFVFFFRSYVNTFPALLLGDFFFTATFTLFVIFIPKMISLYKDPKGENVFIFQGTNHQATQLSKVTAISEKVVSNALVCAEYKQLQAQINSLHGGPTITAVITEIA